MNFNDVNSGIFADSYAATIFNAPCALLRMPLCVSGSEVCMFAIDCSSPGKSFERFRFFSSPGLSIDRSRSRERKRGAAPEPIEPGGFGALCLDRWTLCRAECAAHLKVSGAHLEPGQVTEQRAAREGKQSQISAREP